MITNKCHVIMIGQLFYTQYSMAHMQIKSQTFSKIAKKNHRERQRIKIISKVRNNLVSFF